VYMCTSIVHKYKNTGGVREYIGSNTGLHDSWSSAGLQEHRNCTGIQGYRSSRMVE
jgi:hypothetical protein